MKLMRIFKNWETPFRNNTITFKHTFLLDFRIYFQILTCGIYFWNHLKPMNCTKLKLKIWNILILIKGKVYSMKTFGKNAEEQGYMSIKNLHENHISLINGLNNFDNLFS